MARMIRRPYRNDPDARPQRRHEERVRRIAIPVVIQHRSIDRSDDSRDGGFDVLPVGISRPRPAWNVAAGEIVEPAIANPNGETTHVLGGPVLARNTVEPRKPRGRGRALAGPNLPVRRNVANLEVRILFTLATQHDLIVAAWRQSLALRRPLLQIVAICAECGRRKLGVIG